MRDHSLVLIGEPDSGKTNYIARLWEALSSREGALAAPRIPTEIKYVEDALQHLLQGQFAPRSDTSSEDGHNFSVPVVRAGSEGDTKPFHIIVPDVSGELWKRAVETSELPQHWMDQLEQASGAVLFVRINSDQNVEPLDWVTASTLMRFDGPHENGAAPEKRQLPTQVALCELIRFLELRLGKSNPHVKPRLAVLITAWDRLDDVRAARGPTAFLDAEFPLLGGRLRDVSKFEVNVFGVSVVGGDFIDEEFKQGFFQKSLKACGYIVEETEHGVEKKADLTLPVAWAVRD